jgi:hypothetical protein
MVTDVSTIAHAAIDQAQQAAAMPILSNLRIMPPWMHANELTSVRLPSSAHNCQ